MKRKGILITLILIAIVAAAGGLTVNRMKKTVVTPILTPTPTESVQAVSISDADLEKDTQDIDTKVKALTSDATSIDEGLNDQQGNLSEQ
jgi:hypothetical protein